MYKLRGGRLATITALKSSWYDMYLAREPDERIGLQRENETAAESSAHPPTSISRYPLWAIVQ